MGLLKSSIQNLYGESSYPHQLTGVFQTGSTCSNQQGQGYASSYDAFGKVTTRNYNSTTATLSYDGLDQLVKWDNGNGGQEQYVYDAGGSRVLRRSTVAGNTTMTVSAFGTEEHQYNGAGVNQANTYSYSLGGHLIGESTGTTTNLFLTDGLGSVITAISASVQGNQAYGPYGNTQYQAGAMGTAKGEFSLLFLVNVGIANEESGRVYVGGDAVVSLQQIHAFISSLRQVFREMS